MAACSKSLPTHTSTTRGLWIVLIWTNDRAFTVIRLQAECTKEAALVGTVRSGEWFQGPGQ